jgi:hypothetical protein
MPWKGLIFDIKNPVGAAALGTELETLAKKKPPTMEAGSIQSFVRLGGDRSIMVRRAILFQLTFVMIYIHTCEY